MMHETSLRPRKSPLAAPRFNAAPHDPHRVPPGGRAPVPLDTLLGMPTPESAWIMPGLLPQGVTVLTGKQHVGKSELALLLALALANDTQALGCAPTLPGEVLFLGLEASRHRLSSKAQKLLQGQAAPHAFEWAGNWTLLSEGGLADIEDWLEKHTQPRLVVIDTLDSIHPLPARLGGLFAGHHALMLPFQAMAATHRVAILLLHHQCREEVASELGLMLAQIDCLMEVRRTSEGEYAHRGGRPTSLLHMTGHTIEEREIVLTHAQVGKQWRL